MTANSNNATIDRVSRFATRHKFVMLALTLIVTGMFAVGMFRVKGEVLMEELLPYEHPFLQIIFDFSENFGSGGSWVGILIEAKDGDIFKPHILQKIIDIDEEVASWEETFRVLTFSIGSRSAQASQVTGTGEIGFESVMFPNSPQDQEGLKRLKKLVFSDSTLRELVASEGNAVLVQTEFKPRVSYTRSFELLNNLSQKYSDKEISVEAAGFPVLMAWIFNLSPQTWLVFAVSVGLMIIILFFIFRNLVGMLVPIIIGLISTIIGLGFIGWTGINFSPLLYVLAFLVGARNISHSVQVAHRYMEELAASNNNKDHACFATVRAMIMPNVVGVLTDAAGFLVLIFAKIILMQHVAYIMSFWMLSIAFSAVLTPIFCTFIPMKNISEEYSKKRTRMDWWDRANMASTRFSIGSGRYVIVLGVIGLLVFSGWQASRLKIGDPTPGSPLLWPDHSFNRTVERMNNYFGASSDDLVLYFKGDKKEAVYDPAVFRTFEAFDRHMFTALPDIYKSSDSFINIMKTINIMFRDADVIHSRLPSTAEQMNVLIGFSRENVQLATKSLYFDREMKMTRLSVFFTDHTSDNLLRIRDAAYDFFEKYPMKIDAGTFQLAGGRVGMEIAVNEEMKRSHLLIDCMVLATILIMCSIFFRSTVAGLMLTIPLILPNMMAFAYMSVMDIGLSINTLPVAAVGVGVGVDFAIYLYSRVIEEFPHQEGWMDTILVAVRTSGKAVVYTGLTLILAIIPWYFISALKFQAQIGFFLSMLLLMNVVLALTLHPLLIYLIKPRFVSRGLDDSSGEKGI